MYECHIFCFVVALIHISVYIFKLICVRILTRTCMEECMRGVSPYLHLSYSASPQCNVVVSSKPTLYVCRRSAIVQQQRQTQRADTPYVILFYGSNTCSCLNSPMVSVCVSVWSFVLTFLGLLGGKPWEKRVIGIKVL